MKNYVGEVCWQSFGYATIYFGVVVDQKLEDNGWLMVQVVWDKSQNTTWEKILNVSFKMPVREKQ